MKRKIIIIIFLSLSKICIAQVFDTVSYYSKYSPKQLHQDIDFLLKKFEEIHPDYFNETPKDTVIKRYSDLKAKITRPMNRLDFMNLFAPVAFNMLHDGHNYVNPPDEEFKMYTKKGGKFFPLPVKMLNRKLFVNSKTTDIPYNSEILSINGVSAKDVINRLLGGYKAESDLFEEVLNSDWFNSEYWYNYGGFKKYQFTFKLAESETVKKVIVDGEGQKRIDKERYERKQKKYFFNELPQLQTGVITFNECEDLKNFKPFCDSVFTIIKDKGYKSLIIDIRENLGGTTRLGDVLLNYITTKPVTQYQEIETKISKEKKKDFIIQNRKYAGWFKWYNYLYYPIYIRTNKSRKQILTAKNGTFVKQVFVPKAPGVSPLSFYGNVYLLTGEKTYSSAAFLAAAFKCYHIGTIIGQETGEPTCFTANWVPVILPNTKLECAISAERFVLPCGKNDGHGVVPDYIITDTNLSNGYVDQEMDFTKKMIQHNKKSN